MHAEVEYDSGLGRDHCKFCRATRVACKPAKDGVDLEIHLVDPDDCKVTVQAVQVLSSMIQSVIASAPVWQEGEWSWQTPGSTCCDLLQEMGGRLLPLSNTAILTAEAGVLRCTSQSQDNLSQAQQAVAAAGEVVMKSLNSLRIRRAESSQS